MPDTKLDLEELDLDTDLNENEEAKNLLSNLDILVDIYFFRPFCSLLACSRRAVGDDESGS